MQLELSPRQRRLVAAAATTLAVLVVVAAGALVLYGISRFLSAFSGILLPLAFSAVAALVVKPYYDWFVDRGLHPGLAVTLVLLSGILPVAVGLFFFGRLLFQQIQDLLVGLPEWWSALRGWIEERLPELNALLERFGLRDRLASAVDASQSAIVSGLQSMGGGAFAAGARVFRGIGHLLSWAVVPVYFTFFLMMTPPEKPGDTLLPFLKPETRNDVLFLSRELVAIIVSFFRGQLIVALLMGVLFAIGFTLVGLSYGFVLGIALGLLNIIPYLGSMVGLAVCLPLGYFQDGGGWTTVGLVVVVFTVVQLIEGNVLTPQVMGHRTGLHPLAVIVSFFFWGTALDGILGMILAVPLTAFLVVAWRLLREKYIEELV